MLCRWSTLVVLPAMLALLPSLAVAQGYTLRPGTRGYNPKFNPYGQTEQPGTAQPPRESAAAARAALVGGAAAGTASRAAAEGKTTLRIEILLPPDGAALAAQQWGQTFAEIGFPARFRQPVFEDGPKLEQTTQGPLRFVTLVGALDRRGTVVFPGHTFTAGQAAALKEWLVALKTYGAQGSPTGQPLWGLNRSQFESVYRHLSEPVTADVRGLPLPAALERLALPADVPTRMSVAAQQALRAPSAVRAVSRSVAGLSAGTATAAVLSEFGLSFRPARTPAGTLELLIDVVDPAQRGSGEGGACWPVGWDIDETAAATAKKVRADQPLPPPNRVQIARPLFQIADISIAKMPLLDALAQVEQASGVPVLVDVPAAAAAGIDLLAPVSQPARRTSWAVVLRSLTLPHGLQGDIRRDENGQPLVWVTPPPPRR